MAGLPAPPPRAASVTCGTTSRGGASWWPSASALWLWCGAVMPSPHSAAVPKNLWWLCRCSHAQPLPEAKLQLCVVALAVVSHPAHILDRTPLPFATHIFSPSWLSDKCGLTFVCAAVEECAPAWRRCRCPVIWCAAGLPDVQLTYTEQLLQLLLACAGYRGTGSIHQVRFIGQGYCSNCICQFPAARPVSRLRQV